MLRYLAPYLTVLVLAMAAGTIAYSTGRIDAAGLYGLLYAGLFIAGIGVVRWERRHPHRH